MDVSTPAEITSEIRKFCSRINSACKMSWVDVKPITEAVAGQCYYNVADHTKNAGGKIVFGWMVWESPHKFIEAEHHAIWGDKGLLLDITPKQDGENKILFLHDPSKPFKFKKPNWPINIRKSISEDPRIEKWLEARTKFDKFMLKNSNPKRRERETKISPNQMEHYQKLKSLVDFAFIELDAS